MNFGTLLLLAGGGFFIYKLYEGYSTTTAAVTNITPVPPGSGPVNTTTGAQSGATSVTQSTATQTQENAGVNPNALPAIPATPNVLTNPFGAAFQTMNLQLALTEFSSNIDVFLAKAASGIAEYAAVAKQQGVTLSVHQWNWYRSQTTGQDATTDFGLGNAGNIGIDTYLQAVGRGMSGLGAVQTEGTNFGKVIGATPRRYTN